MPHNASTRNPLDLSVGRFKTFCLFLFGALISGCSAMGIYDSDFTCPASYNGRCISVGGAYDIARKGQDGPEYDPAEQTKKGKTGTGLQTEQQGEQPPHDVPLATYKQSLFKRFDALLKEPTTPIVAPPQVMRVLLLPYKGETNELYMLRYVYFFVDEPKWVLGDSVTAPDEED